MNKYESIIIVNPNVDEAGLKALEEKFTGLINENGKVESFENQGKKKLAYEIKKFKEATYMLFKDDIKEWEKSINVTLTVDNAEEGYKGNTGLVTKYIPELEIKDIENTAGGVDG